MPPRYTEDDLVEDSEPEREAIRRATARPVPLLNKSDSRPLPTKSFSATRNPIFASDPSHISIIEISDDSITTSQPKDVKAPWPDVELELSSSSLSSFLPITSTKKTAPPASLATNEEDLPSDDELPSLGLSKFTFNHVKGKGTAIISRPSTRPFATSATSTLTTLANVNNGRKISKKIRRVGDRLSEELSEVELAKLLKCVACDVRWTVRKSAPQKLAHIQSCAKKNGLIDETILNLIRNELAKSPIAQLDKGKGKDPSETQPTTILAEIVQDAAPKKRIKRQDVATTVRNLEETRKAILDRAQLVLAQGSHAFRALHSVENITSIEPPATPEFTASHLARTRGSKQSIFDPTSHLNEHEGPVFPTLNPPSVQPPNVLTVSDMSNKDTIMATPQKVRPSTSNIPLIYISSSSSDSSPIHPTTTSEYQNSTFSRLQSRPDIDTELQDHDDVYLHYSPPLAQPVTNSPTNTTPPWNDECVPADTPAPFTPAPKMKPDNSVSKTTKRRQKRVLKRAEYEPQFDEAWEEQIRSKIMADKDLYRRILRFEPVSFKTFLDFATGSDTTSSGKLKLSLRQFLDKQAIIFYDEENIGRRR